MEKINWGKVEAVSEGYAAPPAGGYVLAICKVEDYPDKQYLKIYYDIAGVADPKNEEFVGYYGQRTERSGNKIPLPSFIRSYKPAAQGFFKGYLKALEASNARFEADAFNGDEKQFCGMAVGAVLAEEEYVWNGKLNVRLKVHTVCSVERIQKGDFKVPPIKKYEGEIPANNAAPTSYTPFSSVNDADIPF